MTSFRTTPAYRQADPPVGPAAAGRPSRTVRRWANAMLAGAVLCVGLMAGLFFAFTVSVMPGLQAGGDRTFVTAMQHINAAIENGVFGLVFVGALLFPAAAAILLFAAGRRAAAGWVAGATVLYLLVLAVTMGIEVPLNDGLARAGDPSRIADLAAVRLRFESTWVPVNNLRTLLNTLSLLCLVPAAWPTSRVD